jgi:exopolysaccharide biosynthesis polyprenyl glycosylphosphotransferase
VAQQRLGQTNEPLNEPIQQDEEFYNIVTPNQSKVYHITKRIIDIIGSLLALTVLSPVYLITAIAIKIDDPNGSIIYSQSRVGKDGKQFRFYKFRSMCVNADAIRDQLLGQNEMDGPVFKIRNDPRVTRVGKVIRRTSIDELPQFWNVLKGDMSIVGPRPPLPKEVSEYDSYQMQRLIVKPGITCIWQITGRNDNSFTQWVELDLEYINKQNTNIDISILMKTIPAVFRMKGAA